MTVLITGASQGLGYAFAKLFAEGGYNLVLIARSKEKLTVIAHELEKEFSISVSILAKDLTQSGAPLEIFAELQKKKIEIDILVNNAGFATYGLFSETNIQEEVEEIQLNITSLTYLTKLFLPQMLRRKKGKILNIASLAAFLPGPLMAVYYATKAYVLHFSEALAQELKGTGVEVTTLCPGTTATGFVTRAHMEKSKLFKGKPMDVMDVARAGYQGLLRGKTVVIPSNKNKMFAFFSRILPHSLTVKIVQQMQEKI